ncbi:MAG: hypothetical protein WC142_01865 [Bacteroidales bacterium]|jgi:Tfp pilus assembly protein PilN|nr:hypothetical protein [Bacteroidales bacterium]MDD3330696.1 hypothetical protein [Bacteroidales bacterium]MDD3692095.1 hypothetical protein [Bacteroidales bacterium]MDD4044851.1 hypothetical protein [Bacteroidales bacterium]MDD4581576.1 hypothetical protein [Bacteroidales bacterium]
MFEPDDTLKQEVKKYKKLTIIFVIISIVLACLLVFSFLNVKQINVEKEQSIVLQEELQEELDSILFEYENIKQSYGDLNDQLSERDSAIVAQAKEIEQLIASQADYRRIKKKLELLQNQGKEYVRLLDSLYVVNKELTIENQEVKTENLKLSQQKQELTKEKEILTEKVSTAAKLKAYNISFQGMSLRMSGKKEKETDRARQVDMFRVTFTLSENQLIPEGEINIYCRISLPDGRVLALGTGDAYSFYHNEKKLQYTIKSIINYEKKAKSINMEWKLRQGDSAVPGSYTAQLFTDDDYIGEAILTLK